MLHALMEYAQREELSAQVGFKPKTIRWLLLFSPEGAFLGVQDLAGGDRRSRGRLFPACPDLTQQELVAAGGGCRHFLVDNLEVIVLLTKKETVDKKLAEKHRFSVDLLRRAASCVPELAAIARALDDESVLQAIREKLTEHKAKPADLATVAVVAEPGNVSIVVERTDWHAWWIAFRTELADRRKAKAAGGRRRSKDSESAPAGMRCLLTGELAEPQPTHNKVEGLADVGGLPTGDVVAGFDKDAFTSFGLKQGANAAMSEQAVKTYVTALNHLIRNRSHRLAGAKVAYWYSGPVPEQFDALADVLSGVEPAQPADESPPGDSHGAAPSRQEQAQAESRAKRALDAIRSGQPIGQQLAHYRYYAITLSANSGRVVVRDWMEGHFPELAENVDAWFSDLAIVRRDGQGVVTTHKFAALLAAPLRDLKDASAPLTAALWRSAVKRLPIPYEIMARTLGRVRIDLIGGEAPRHARFALLKAFCNRNERIPNMTPQLNEMETNPAYLCGRIMAVLARIQHAALGDVGAGVVQRYYAAASATPALVLGRLIRTAQIAHLPKIGSKGLRIWFDKQLGELCSKLPQAPPRALSLEDQTLFALGYYHQSAQRPEQGDAETAEQAPADQ